MAANPATRNVDKAIAVNAVHALVPIRTKYDGTACEDKLPKHPNIFRPNVIARDPAIVLHGFRARPNRSSVLGRLFAGRIVELLSFVINAVRIRPGSGNPRRTR